MVNVDLIDEVELTQALEQLGFDCYYRQHTESTNADVLKYYVDHQREVVSVSEAQSAGRGRRGRKWLSPFARNIYCTIGIIKNMPASDQGLMSIVTGIALCRALRDQFAIPVSLKWPNDLLHQGSKLGGILIESRPLENNNFFFAIGFGLNVFMQSDELADIPQSATSLQLISPISVNRSEVLIRCFEAVVQAIRKFDSAKAVELVDEFNQYDAYRDQTVEVLTAQGNQSGINCGISSQGHLRLETVNGIEEHSSAEISVQAVK